MAICQWHAGTGYHGVNRLIDYQDEAYAEEWLSRVSALIDRIWIEKATLSPKRPGDMALWMALKTYRALRN